MKGLFSLIKRLLIGAFFISFLFDCQLVQAEGISFSLSKQQLIDKFSCSDEQSRAVEVEHQGSSYLAMVPEIAETPIVNSSIVCRTFLDLWKQDLEDKKYEFTIREDVGRKDTQIFYLDFPELVKSCVELGYCTRSMFDYFSLNDELYNCQPTQNLSTIFSRMVPRFRTPVYKFVPKVDLHIFPFVPLVEKLHDYMDESSGVVYASTMTLGEGTATKMFMKYKESNSKMILAIDAGLALATGQGLMLGTYYYKNENLFAVPMTAGHEFKTLYHWKLIADPDRDISLISSMNLSTPLKTPYIDLVYEFPKNKDLSLELLNKLSISMKQQCSRKKDLHCLTSFSEEKEVAKSRIGTLIDRSCEQIEKVDFTAAKSGGFFMEPQTDDVEDLSLKLIKAAEKEIILLTHKFSLPSIAEALKEADERGVSVKLFSSVRPRLKAELGSWFYYPEKLKERYIPEPHMKLLLIDRDTLLFGTGNFTYNAFNDAKELFAMTKDPDAVNRSLLLANSFYHGYAPEKSKEFYNYNGEQWIVGDIRKFGTEERLNKLAYTIKPSQDWMVHYRGLSKQGEEVLASCDLSHLLMVPEHDYAACLNRFSSSKNLDADTSEIKSIS